jgi:hypothetical protein
VPEPVYAGEIDVAAVSDLHEYLQEVEGALTSYFAVEACVLRYNISEEVDAVCTWNGGRWTVRLEPKAEKTE